jgi:hypothetical protein
VGCPGNIQKAIIGGGKEEYLTSMTCSTLRIAFVGERLRPRSGMSSPQQ